MSLQMQFTRAAIALVIGSVLGAVALSRAAGMTADADVVAGSAGQTASRCQTSLRIEVSDLVRVNVACDWSCAPVRGVMHALHVPVNTRPATCHAQQAL